MRSKRLTWVYLSSFMGFVLVSGAAFSEPVGSRKTPLSQQSQAQVSTNRSDGAIFPAVIQTRRIQKRRLVRVSSSGQALSNRKLASAQEEAAMGGRFVAPATGAVEAEYATPQVQTLVPYVAIDIKAKPKAKR